MTKFKIGFTMSAETLFGIISKFVPVENLHVEEVIEHHVPLSDLAIRSDKQFDLPKPKRHRRSNRFNPKGGINMIIIEAMADGKPHRPVEFGPLLKANGYSPNSVGSRMTTLLQKGVIAKIGDGTWKLVSSIPERKESA
jgi:hypothetical protein